MACGNRSSTLRQHYRKMLSKAVMVDEKSLNKTMHKYDLRNVASRMREGAKGTVAQVIFNMAEEEDALPDDEV